MRLTENHEKLCAQVRAIIYLSIFLLISLLIIPINYIVLRES